MVLCVIFGPRHLTECTGSWDPHMLPELGWGRSLAGGGACLVLLEKFYTALKSLLWGSIVWICWAAHIKLGFVFRMQSHIADLLIGICGIYMDALCSVGALHDTGGGIKGV